MTCKHKRVWEMAATDRKEILKEYLHSGFEPYAVVHTDFGTYYHFKRLKPCEECKKV